MLARLVPLGEGPSISIDRSILLIGRHPDCDVRVRSPKVSRRHCLLALVSDRLVIRDLASTNGVRVNGKRVQESALVPRDEVTIGDVRFQLVVDGSVEPEQGGKEPRLAPSAAADPPPRPAGASGPASEDEEEATDQDSDESSAEYSPDGTSP
jgi:pSer/pThr/pTyr-binding forkhead associated (FHA) protein